MRPLVIALGLTFATNLSAQDIPGHLSAGDAARCRRNAEEALAHYRAALALDSIHYDANWKTSQILVDIGKMLPDAQRARRDSLYNEAVALAQRAVRANSQGADGHFMVAVATGRMALTKGPRERVRYANVVRESALRAIELDPRHAGAMHVLGRWNAEVMRLPGLTKMFAKAFLGASVFNQASWANAEAYFDQAIGVEPNNIYHHLDLAETLVDSRSAGRAVTHLELVAQLPLGCDPADGVYRQQAAALLTRISRQ